MSEASTEARRWQRVERIFRDAVELPVQERPAFLEAACEGDLPLLREVEELLEADAEAGDFITSAVKAGEDLLAQSAEQLPARFGKYEVEGRLGEGGFGVVYRGRDPMLDRPVAIKACARSDEGMRRRFYREARIAAGLRHTNITTVHELGVEEGVPFLVQELLEGEDLRQIIGGGRPLPLPVLVGYLVGIARGLEHAHGAGVLHRDVKPANVRILPDGTVKLMDFGIAKVLGADTGLTGTGMTMGTVGYLAPEQLRSESVDERADIFSFGVLAYELLGGVRPFRGGDFSQVSYQLLYVDPPPLRDVWRSCPEPLGQLIDRCLAKQKVDRPGGMMPVRRQLEALAQELSTSIADPVPIGTTPASARQSSEDRSDRTLTRPKTNLGPQEEVGSRERGVRYVAAAALMVAGSVGFWLFSGEDIVVPEGSEEPVTVAESERPEVLEVPLADLPRPVAEDPIPQGMATATAGPRQTISAEVPDPVSSGSDDRRSDGPGSAAAAADDPPETSPPGPNSAIAPQSSGDTIDAVDEVLSSPPAESDDGSEPILDESREMAKPLPPQPLLEDDVSSDFVTTDLETSPDAPEAIQVRQQASEETLLEAAGQEPLSSSSGDEQLSIPAMQLGDPITGPGPGVEPPKLLRLPQPEYPARARRRRIEGRAVVKVLVDEYGKVLQVSAGGPDEHGFMAAAREVAAETLFEPATRDGVAGRMWVNLPFDFTLD